MIPSTASDFELALLALTCVSLGAWISDAKSALTDYRETPGGIIGELALYILTLRLGWALVQVVFLFAFLAAAAAPEPAQPTPFALVFRLLSVFIQVASIVAALWGRSLRGRVASLPEEPA